MTRNGGGVGIVFCQKRVNHNVVALHTGVIKETRVLNTNVGVSVLVWRMVFPIERARVFHQGLMRQNCKKSLSHEYLPLRLVRGSRNRKRRREYLPLPSYSVRVFLLLMF